jgi:hypothetical protein
MVEVTVVQWVITIIIAIIYGVAYSLLNYLTKTTPEKIDAGRLIASILFGVFIGLVMVYQDASLETINWTLVGTVFFAFQGALMWLNSIVDYIWLKITGKKVLEKAFG